MRRASGDEICRSIKRHMDALLILGQAIDDETVRLSIKEFYLSGARMCPGTVATTDLEVRLHTNTVPSWLFQS